MMASATDYIVSVQRGTVSRTVVSLGLLTLIPTIHAWPEQSKSPHYWRYILVESPSGILLELSFICFGRWRGWAWWMVGGPVSMWCTWSWSTALSLIRGLSCIRCLSVQRRLYSYPGKWHRLRSRTILAYLEAGMKWWKEDSWYLLLTGLVSVYIFNTTMVLNTEYPRSVD